MDHVSNYKDTVVIITGGSSGIGAAMVTAFAKVGAKVIFLDTDEEGGLSLADSCKSKQLDVSFIQHATGGK